MLKVIDWLFKVIDWLLLPKDTYELVRLNKIHEAFNDKRITPEQTRHLIYSFKWKHNHKKIDLIVRFTYVAESVQPPPLAH